MDTAKKRREVGAIGELDGKVAIVTGGASFIGEAIGKRLSAAGAAVMLADRDAPAGAAAANRLGERVRFLETDVTDDARLDLLVESTVADLGGIDILVSAAAVFDDNRFESSRTLWHRAIDINVVSAAVLTGKVVPHLSSGSAVVYVASVSGTASQPNRLVYNVTKAALLMLAKAGAQELAPRGIRVNTVSPGWTWSTNVQKRYGSRKRADAFAAEFQPLGRMADPGEVADAIQFIVSDRARFITGTDLAVDGGYGALGPEALGQPYDKVPPLDPTTGAGASHPHYSGETS